MTKKIFFKIKEQLEDNAHPLIWIIQRFRDEFIKDITKQLEMISNMASLKVESDTDYMHTGVFNTD